MKRLPRRLERRDGGGVALEHSDAVALLGDELDVHLLVARRPSGGAPGGNARPPASSPRRPRTGPRAEQSIRRGRTGRGLTPRRPSCAARRPCPGSPPSTCRLATPRPRRFGWASCRPRSAAREGRTPCRGPSCSRACLPPERSWRRRRPRGARSVLDTSCRVPGFGLRASQNLLDELLPLVARRRATASVRFSSSVMIHWTGRRPTHPPTGSPELGGILNSWNATNIAGRFVVGGVRRRRVLLRRPEGRDRLLRVHRRIHRRVRLQHQEGSEVGLRLLGHAEVGFAYAAVEGHRGLRAAGARSRCRACADSTSSCSSVFSASLQDSPFTWALAFWKSSGSDCAEIEAAREGRRW